jgi:predicted glycogen debranching enzyme
MVNASAEPTVSDPGPPPRESVVPGTLLSREWLVTNGLGGYASGTASGVATRRYHGLLVAALPAPLGRMMMLNQLSERLLLPDGATIPIGVEGAQRGGSTAGSRLADFRLEAGLPVWRFKAAGVALERRVVIAHLQNTSYICYRLADGAGPVHLVLRPAVHFRPHDAPVDAHHPGTYRLSAQGDQYEIAVEGLPPLRLFLCGPEAAFTLDFAATDKLTYEIEAGRGYEHTGDLWSPGYFRVRLDPGVAVTLVASTEPWETLRALSPEDALRAERTRRARLIRVARPQARGGFAADLVGAADQFLITPAGRVEDTARAHAAGEEVRTVIAGYHWFTDWGRDTMISLEGLTLATGRHAEAGYILRTFAYYIHDGLIPNMFPEGRTRGLYHTADATLWFFHAIDRYLEATGDQETLHQLLPKLLDIVEHHVRGTRFGIGVDPRDGLLRQGEPGYQLTWMDAKVGDWVVTPRRGKAVEINALWYNALKLVEGWARESRGEATAGPLAELAAQVRRSFNARFWYEEGDYLYDVIDGESGDDPACRPNQLFAIALKHPVLDRPRWEPVVEVSRRKLLTPVGLRSLSPDHPDYKPRYDGDLRARDAAYHQGTVWAWLIGPFIDAWLKLHPDDRAGARRFLDGFGPHLNEACLGSISEIFDAEPPFTPRGCIAQAWSVAEVLRSWVKTAGDG